MHPEHAILLGRLQDAARRPAPGSFDAARYHGTKHPVLGVPVPERRRIARDWAAPRRGGSEAEVLEVVESLFAGASHEEKSLASLLLDAHARARRQVRPQHVERWLEHLDGWAEVDGLCQSTFSGADLLDDWPAWKALIERLAGDPDINRRRAALVLLTRPVHTADDARLRDLAFATIGRLKPERPVIISKAVSWLLRSMITNHRDAVARYVEDRRGTLPAIAVRETRAKLATGRK